MTNPLRSIFNLFLSFLWIGAQFPQEKFLSYGRILTLDYYFLLMCILFHYNNSLHSYFLYLFFLNNGLSAESFFSMLRLVSYCCSPNHWCRRINKIRKEKKRNNNNSPSDRKTLEPRSSSRNAGI